MSQSNEFLLNNALAEDFQQMLRPFYLTQRLLCASKYIIKDSFVLPNSKAYCAVKVLVLCFIIYAYFAVLSYIISTFVNILVTLQIVIEWTKSGMDTERLTHWMSQREKAILKAKRGNFRARGIND
ncbi:hypothetical protein EVAR_56740_1 [Eumeta japonica]|uniref:Uncharacterized protein n=1 Tax=Eumeta variegata TaxID=151549 RepID=A0A4C1ZS81_EUMVA|nr:hypothetical protein EVAR_56740_1 [Eumeta japonica]